MKKSCQEEAVAAAPGDQWFFFSGELWQNFALA
jgi:hypothetical protein